MLAGEPFTDRPASVCPVIIGFMRAYNDRVDDTRRQTLYRYASEVVGTRATPEIEQMRERRCLEWIDEMRQSCSRRVFSRRESPDSRFGIEAAGTCAARSIRRHTDQTHAAALALVEELIAMGRTTKRAQPVVEIVTPRVAELATATA